jgi:hypothetical protein
VPSVGFVGVNKNSGFNSLVPFIFDRQTHIASIDLACPLKAFDFDWSGRLKEIISQANEAYGAAEPQDISEIGISAG